MSVFSDPELTYLAQGKLGRPATIDAAGLPHVVPLGWRYHPDLDVIDIGGRDFARTRWCISSGMWAYRQKSDSSKSPI
jgi:pyridoxamine 5'-phosphate oxidase family protein